ncbi:unnamed protein product, partial [Ixodes persulcatus]
LVEPAESLQDGGHKCELLTFDRASAARAVVKHKSKLYPSLSTSDLACAVATILIASIIILTSYLLLSPVEAEGPDGLIMVSGPFGRVRGLALQASGRRVYAFLGLPYAEPPVLERRFKRTVLRRAPADGDKEVRSLRIS